MTALLLAEPEPSMRGFLERQLRSDGFDVLAFPSTDELPRSAEPDVLVLGDPDALDRCRVPDCPVIVLDRGELVVDRAARRVLAQGREVVVSQKEYALLVKLAVEPDREFTRELLLRDVWGYPGFAPTRTLESHASRLRRKLAACGLEDW